MNLRLLLLILLQSAIAPIYSFADENKLLGTWEAGDRIHESIYGAFKFTPDYMYFSPNGKWICKTKYEIEVSGTAATYPDQPKDIFSNARNIIWSYHKLRLGKSKCTTAPYFLMAIPSDKEDYAEFIEYDSDLKYTGWGHFHKLIEEQK